MRVHASKIRAFLFIVNKLISWLIRLQFATSFILKRTHVADRVLISLGHCHLPIRAHQIEENKRISGRPLATQFFIGKRHLLGVKSLGSSSLSFAECRSPQLFTHSEIWSPDSWSANFISVNFFPLCSNSAVTNGTPTTKKSPKRKRSRKRHEWRSCFQSVN